MRRGLVQGAGPRAHSSPVPRERVAGRAGWPRAGLRKGWVQNSLHSSGQPGVGGRVQGQMLGLGWASTSGQVSSCGRHGLASVGLGLLL